MREGLATTIVFLVLVIVQWSFVLRAAHVIPTDSAHCEMERRCRLSGGQRSAEAQCRRAGPLDASPNICLSRKARWCRSYPHTDECRGFVQTRNSTNWVRFYELQDEGL